jgi:hypothetical protein
LKREICLLLFGTAAVSCAYAQTRASSELRIHVVDPSGAVVANAAVTVFNQDTGLQRSGQTNGKGDADFADLPLTGGYEVSVTSEGFSAAKQSGLLLNANTIAQVQFRLAVSEATTAEVNSTATTIDVTTTQLGNRFNSTELNNVPVPGRKISTAALLDSAVRPARQTGDAFLDQTLFVFNGAGRRQTTFSIDNVSGDDTWGRQTMFTAVPFSSVQEFDLIRNPISAEYGRTSGNAINVVTKSGTNTLHGDFIGLWRPSQLEANAPLAKSHTGDKLAQGSGTVSGPIVTDRTHFLVSEEYSANDRSSVILSPLDPQAIYTGHAKQELFLARLDHSINSNNHLAVRANLDRLTDTNPQDAVGNFALPSTARTFARKTYSGMSSLSTAINPRTANEARLQWQLGSPITQFVPQSNSTQFVYPGYATIGESRYASLIDHQYEMADTVTHIAGRHTWKFGATAEQSSSGGFGQEFGSGFLQGQFTVKPSANGKLPSQLTLNDVSRFQQSFGNPQYNIREWLGSVFAQDNWRASSNLSLELGIRYEAQSFTDDHNNVSPRVGLAYKLPNTNTVVRASYGIFYSEEVTDLAANDKLGGPQGVFTFSAAPGQFGFPTSLTALPAFPQGAVLPPRDIYVRAGQAAYLSQFFDVSKLRFYPNALLNPYTDQWTASIEHEFAGGWLVTADYTGQRTFKIERPVDLNAPAPFIRTQPGQVRSAAAADATRPIVPIPGGYRRIIAYVNQGKAWYDGLHIEARKRFGRRFDGLVSYTYSHTENTVETDAPSQDPNDSNQLGAYEKATSLLDQRHRLSVNGSYALPWGLQIGSWISAGSGMPYNVTTGVDNNGDGSLADRPVVNGVVVPRNWGRGTPTYDIASYVQKSVRITDRMNLGLRAEGFNLTNANNIIGRNGVYGNGATPNASFGTALSGVANVQPGRQFQFQARLMF